MKTTRTTTNKVVSPKRRASKTKVSTGAQRQPALSSKNGDIARGGVAVPFPWRLHEMLEDSHREGNDWIVSWAPHGRSFTVQKPKIFVEKIMPTYFNQSKFWSCVAAFPASIFHVTCQMSNNIGLFMYLCRQIRFLPKAAEFVRL